MNPHKRAIGWLTLSPIFEHCHFVQNFPLVDEMLRKFFQVVMENMQFATRSFSIWQLHFCLQKRLVNFFYNDSQILGNFCTHISLYIGPVVGLSLLLVDGISTPFLSEQVLGLFKCHQKIALRTLAPTSPCFNSYISPLVFFINYEFVLFVYFKHSQMKYSARNKQYLNC